MHLETFLAYLKHEKRYSEHTVTSYRNDLEQFYRYIKQAFDIENISEASHLYIRSWMAQMSEDNIGSRSINRKISALRSYCRFLMKRGLLDKDPTLKIQTPKAPKSLPVYVEQQDIGKLFDELQMYFDDSFYGRRDRMVLELLYYTGMRRAELLNLKDADVDLARCHVKVLGKGNKERLIPISQHMADSLHNYISEKCNLYNTPWLLVTDKGAKLYPELTYRIVKKFLSLVTTIEKRSPHVLRHSFATHLTNNGAEINAVKDLLGHASLAATQVYTHNNIEQLKDIYKNTHPKA